MQGPASPALSRLRKGKRKHCETTPDNPTPQAKRAVVRAYRSAMISIWDKIQELHQYSLMVNARKHRHKKGMYVLSAKWKGKKKSRHNKIIYSDQFDLIYPSIDNAKTAANQLKFGQALFSYLQSLRVKFRPDLDSTHTPADDNAKKKKKVLPWYKSNDEEKRLRLSVLAKTHNIEQEMIEATKDYTSWDCIKDWKRISNFCRSLRRERNARIKREKMKAKYRELAQFLRKGL